jgi:hypothetical protein
MAETGRAKTAEVTMNNSSEDDAMHLEWKAWHTVVKEWPGDINEPRYTRLVKAIQRWGEWLALLRVEQDSHTRQHALTMAEAAYEKAKSSHPTLGGRQPAREDNSGNG